jgi:DNA-directed RNA polymerase subunit RPC12/RpoP
MRGTTESSEVLVRSGARCPVCSGKIVIDGPDEVIVKNAILRVERLSGRVTAKCARCKTWVEVPLRYVG